MTEPHLPVIFVGTVWGLPILLPQYPRRTGTRLILAKMIAPLMAVATCASTCSVNHHDLLTACCRASDRYFIFWRKACRRLVGSHCCRDEQARSRRGVGHA